MTQLGIEGVRSEVEPQFSDIELSPPEVFEPVLRAACRTKFDFDPSGHPNQLVPVQLIISPPRDGLLEPWPEDEECFAWSNFPYSNPYPWLERASSWVGDQRSIVSLLKLDPTTRWWADFIDGQGVGVLLKDRVRHVKPGRHTNHSSPFPSVLIGLGCFARIVCERLDGVLGKVVVL